MCKNRIRLFQIIAYIILLLLAGRIYYIQIIGHEEFAKTAFTQQTVRLQGIDFKGQNVFMSNGIDFSGNYNGDVGKEYLFIFPLSSSSDAEKKNENLKSRILIDFMRFKCAIRDMAFGANYFLVFTDAYDEKIIAYLNKTYNVFILEKTKGFYSSPYNLYVYTDARGEFLDNIPSIIARK